jgi:hypothetical protein
VWILKACTRIERQRLTLPGEPRPIAQVGNRRSRQLRLAIRQHGIEENEVGLHLLREVERLHASVGRENLEAVVIELLLRLRIGSSASD